MTLLEVNGLHAGYGRKQVLSDVHFSADSHELIGILGANGSGKSTLLKSLCGILPCQGKICICGSELQSLRPRQLAQVCRYIPQRCGITIDMSLTDVVLMGFNPQLGLLAYPDESMKRQAEAALETVGLGDRRHVNFQTLSEGQKQLCILARTLLLDRGVLLLDEPESALDFRERYRLLGLVRDWVQQREGCAVVTLHDPQLAMNTCDRLLMMRNGSIIDVIFPREDSTEKLQAALCEVFGALSLHRCRSQSGAEQLVLLKEE